MNILRRLPLSRLLLLCALVIAVGASVTAIAFALDSGPVPAAKPLAEAVHDALSGASSEQVEGVSARIQLTNHLLEGASLATGGKAGELASNPLLTGASGRLWVAKNGDVRVELEAEKGDTEIYYDGHTVSLYDAATNTLYRYTPPAHEGGAGSQPGQAGSAPAHPTVPSIAQVEEAISHIERHANVSGATPTDVGGAPAYTVRASPQEGGSLLGGVELSFDANNGAPLRAAIYSTNSASSPVIELAVTEVSFGPVSSSIFAFTPPAGAKIEEVSLPAGHTRTSAPSDGSAEKPKLSSDGHGLSSIGVLESKTSTSANGSENHVEGLPQVSINGISASELRTELGTVLSFERAGVRYVLAGAVAPSAIEALAQGL